MNAGRGLRLAATLTVVVLALTGFETSSSSGGSGGKSGSGKSRSGSSSGDGGGCSSSKKKNNDYDSDDYEGSGSGSGGSAATADPSVTSSPGSTVDVVVVECVQPERKKRKGQSARKADTTATLRITSRETFTETFKITLEFTDAGGMSRDSAKKLVTVGPGETKTFEVAMESPSVVDKVRKCEVVEILKQSTGTGPSTTSPTPTP